MAQLWKVVGGADKGGIIVRTGSELTSDADIARLSTDAVVKELSFHDCRLNYELISGTGPVNGWVSTNLRGKDLLVKDGFEEEQLSISAPPKEAAGEQEQQAPGTPEKTVKKAVEKEPSEEEKEALRNYVDKFGEARDGRREGYNRKSFPWFTEQQTQKTTPVAAMQEALAFKGKSHSKKKELKPRLWEVDSEGEDVPMCSQCHLPVGEFSYRGREGVNSCVHAECMAQVIAREAQVEEEQRAKREAAKKLKSRMEYDIGWRVESVPKNAAIAEQLGCSPLPQGLCCLVYDEVAKTVRVAATHEPAAAVNLEYLMLALKVRKDKCREPLFSLDPVDPKNMQKTPQNKFYEPDWLAGTSVGDVMFQADYFLKELALGEYDMPAVGMLSVFDLSEQQDKDKEWAAREWFVVKRAEVRMSHDKTLIPHVKMGVEAREQVLGKTGLEDKAVTSPNHPCKKFAEAFTRNFDLIAERKSVVFHLRELAKASVIAKFLLDSNARLDHTWYQIADDIIKNTKPEAHPQIPQLWNMRGNSRIQLKNGRLVDVFTGGKTSMQAIYGGVQFGLDKFELAQRASLQGSQMMAPGLAPAAMQGMQMGSRQPMFMPQRFQLGQRGETPQGVDLNLDKFNLATPDRMSSLPACSASMDSLEGRVTLGSAFLHSLQQGSYSDMKQEHQELLKGIFNPRMCDRTEEGDTFVPPDPNLEYIGKVRNLVNEEKLTLRRRKTRFFDKAFVVDNPGLDFPSAWTPRFQIETEGRAQTTISADKHTLVLVQADPVFQQFLVNEVLPAAAPEFSKSTEDGVSFRIYRIGSLEIRTTQEQSGEETIGTVFSRRAPSWQLSSGRQSKEVGKGEAITKAKVYIEATDSEKPQPAFGKSTSGTPAPLCRFYVVLETDASNTIVTEKLADGSIAWAVNSDKLEDRNSLARLLFTSDCKNATVEGIKGLQAKPFSRVTTAVASASKAYAKAVFELSTGRGFRGKWGGYVRAGYTGKSVIGPASDYLANAWSARKTAFRKQGSNNEIY